MLCSGCAGRHHEFYFHADSFYVARQAGSPQWLLPLSHPFHAATLLCFCASMLVVPAGYWSIYRCRVH